MSHIISIFVLENNRYIKINFNINYLYCGGFTGRNEEAVKKHIVEMASMNVPKPSLIPSIYELSPSIVTSNDKIEVIGNFTSGEVEAVLLIGFKENYITVGSDHTDREIEKLNYQKSKQICGKVIANKAWKYNDVSDHFDELIIRSEIIKNDREITYQEDSLKLVRNPLDLTRQYLIDNPGTMFFSGTIPTKDGELNFSNYYKIQIIDPILERKIEHVYYVKSL